MAALQPYDSMRKQNVLVYKVRGADPSEECGTDVFFSGWYNEPGKETSGKGRSNMLRLPEGAWYYQWWTPRPISSWCENLRGGVATHRVGVPARGE